MECRMDGRTAIVTGGSLGLGRAMAMEFAKSGANVAIVARGQDALNEAKAEIEAAASTKIGAYSCDMCDPAAIQSMYNSVVSDLGAVDVVVNNAGTSRRGAFMEITDELWREDLELKLFGAIRLIRLAFPGMIERRWGRIINVSTDAASAHTANISYAASKHAIESYSRSAAAEMGKYGITVNIVAPGPIQTGYIRPELERDIATNAPLRRVGAPEDVADVIVLLASEQARWLTGQLLYVGGGWRMHQ